MTLKEAIVEVLSRHKNPLKPAELRDKVLKSGYSTSATPKSFYISIFTTAGKHPSVVKTKRGFRLRKSARKKVAKGRNQ